MGGLREFRRRSRARISGRRRHGGERSTPASSGIPRTRPARLRRPRRLAVRSQRANRNPRRQHVWSARQHHDWQREDFPAGYYSPESSPAVEGSNTLILTHTNHSNPNVADVHARRRPPHRGFLERRDRLGVAWRATISTSSASPPTHGMRSRPRRASTRRGAISTGCISTRRPIVGPNHWFDGGDQRFAPNNVIISSREASLLAIVGRDGKIVWRLGPDFSEVRGAARDSARSSASIMLTSSRRVCRARGMCWCSITAAPAATASPIRSRPTARVPLRAPARACSKSTR